MTDTDNSELNKNLLGKEDEFTAMLEENNLKDTFNSHNSVNHGDCAAFMKSCDDEMRYSKNNISRRSRFSVIAGEHGLTAFKGGLAILSTCVGGGIVGLPNAMYRLGIPLAIFLQTLVIFITHVTSNMYLYVRELVPGRPDSLYEIGYILMGRTSIFAIGSIIIINAFGLCIIYFIVFGDTAGQLVANFVDG